MKFCIFFYLILINSLCYSQESSIKVGDFYSGGIVGYLLQEGDIGFEKNINHGIVVSEKDLALSVKWYNGITTLNIIGARGQKIGTGSTNTSLIIKNHGENRKNYAAGITTLYKGGGFDDWVLPSIDELNVLYLNKKYLGMSDGWYWSSTEGDNYNIWFLDFKFGFKDLARKNFMKVRAIRYF
jgi:hypothetical protein